MKKDFILYFNAMPILKKRKLNLTRFLLPFLKILFIKKKLLQDIKKNFW